jgi:hypothetical protein
VPQDRRNQNRGLALVTVWFFLLLLVSSAPHRVHHFFEDLRISSKFSDDAATPFEARAHVYGNSEHDNTSHEHDHSSGGSAKADCIAQAVAQNFHLAPAQAIEVSSLKRESKTQPAETLAPHYHFCPSPFCQRAPPRA